MQKDSVFQAKSLGANPTKVDVNTTWTRLATSWPFLYPWLISHSRVKREGNFNRQSCEGERERRKSREVDLFHLQECESERKFLAQKTRLTFLTFSCAPHASVAKAENDFHQNVYEYCSLTQINLFVYSAVCTCSQHYWQTAKVPLSNTSWKDKTVLKPIANYFIDRQLL